MEFDITTPIPSFNTYCPLCSRIKEETSLKPKYCKVCKEELIFIELGHIPKEYRPKLTKKTLAGLIIMIISMVGPVAPLIMFFSVNMLFLHIVCMVGGVVIGFIWAFDEHNKQIKKLIRTFIPAEPATIPLIEGVRVFQLGRYLSQDIIPCPKCEMLIPGDSKFCKECGASLLEEK
ncbi:MAG: hypothetical protein HWN65_20680 [Candidatus Helarchaeota archaeon]|nr:hypothetical protein [Candidatus Helarchaeota archaeon]